jgi:hypothetical protein
VGRKFVLALSLLLGLTQNVHLCDAATLRYALVIGNNVGLDPEIGLLPPLRHAEDEARTLHAKLLRLGNFGEGASHTSLLVRPTVKNVLDAVAALREQMNADEKKYGAAKKLFAFFFTGHGLKGRLLLADGPLKREDLASIFRSLHADFTIGVFDACYSGSLDPGSLIAKGFKPTPGLNIFHELPEEVLTAEGTVWFVSSGPNEASYEDRDLGGVFTHFIIDGLEHASTEGPGVSLDKLWDYARAKTVAYTTERNHPQSPQKIVSQLRERGSIYISFPRPRDAMLVLAPGVHGTFSLSYEGTDLSERFQKAAGQTREISVYAGRARLELLDDRGVRVEQLVDLHSGSKLVFTSFDDARASLSLGETVEDLLVKGGVDGQLSAQLIEPTGSLFGGVRYEYGASPTGQVSPRHQFVGTLRYDADFLTLEVGAGYGGSREDFESWGYRMQSLFGAARAGPAFDLAEARFAILVGGEGGPLRQIYDDGLRRDSWFLRPDMSVTATYAFTQLFAAEIAVRGGLLGSNGAGAQADLRWTAFASASLSTMIRIF